MICFPPGRNILVNKFPNFKPHISYKMQFLFALVWALALSLIVFWHFINRAWAMDSALVYAIVPYFVGALGGGILSLKLATTLVWNKIESVRFSFIFSALLILTLGLTSLIFVVQYLIYFSQWHADIGTSLRLHQTIFTGLGALYLMAITGLRPLLPWGVVLLILASLCFSRGWLSSSR